MKKYLFLIILILITVFLTREFLLSQNAEFQIFVEKNYLLIRSESGKIWGYGNINSAGAENLKQSISPYFSREKIRDIYSLEEGKKYQDQNLILQKISRNLVHLSFKKKTFLFFAENFNDQYLEKLINFPLSLKTDWQILNKNIILNFLPKPKQGILYIKDKSPSKKFREISREKNIPLISTKETGGFSLQFTDQWKLKTRN